MSKQCRYTLVADIFIDYMWIKIETNTHNCSKQGSLRWTTDDLMLAHSLRRWTNNKTALGQRLVLTGQKMQVRCHIAPGMSSVLWLVDREKRHDRPTRGRHLAAAECTLLDNWVPVCARRSWFAVSPPGGAGIGGDTLMWQVAAGTSHTNR